MDLLTAGLLATLLVLVVLDFVAPARRFPRMPGWRVRGTLFLVISVALSFALPMLWDPWLAEHRLIDATGLGVAGGAVVGFLVYEVCAYWWHRALHRVPLLWRFHQMHHSAERIDVFGALYFHPVDIAGFTLVTSLALTLIVGIEPEAAGIAATAITALSLFQHANLRTPRWLGYLVQRPESHGVHHQRGVHTGNFADLPVIDMIFGTFRNPATWDGVGGFWDGASAELGALLAARDVTEPGADAPEEVPARPSVA